MSAYNTSCVVVFVSKRNLHSVGKIQLQETFESILTQSVNIWGVSYGLRLFDKEGKSYSPINYALLS
jgi:hypothetical protein